MTGNENNQDNKVKEVKKKQKAGLNAVRPSEYVEKTFKGMAADNRLSQTEMFERIFWNFIRKENDERKQQAIDYSSEINLISKDLSNILHHFKTIAEKGQETVISITTNAEQTKTNLTTEIDTLNKKIEELEKRNIELENTNNVFSEVKNGLEEDISKQNEVIQGSKSEIANLNSLLIEKDKHIKELDNVIRSLEKSNGELERDNDKLSEGQRNNESKIVSLEISNSNLQSTLATIDVLRKSEVDSLEAKYTTVISILEEEIKGYEDNKKAELKELEKRIRAELDADKKMAIADMKLELVELKSKYNESQLELNKLISK